MKPKVFITKRIPLEVENHISQFCEYRKWDKDTPIPRDALLQEIEDVEGIFNHNCRIDEELIIRAPKLKIVSNMTVGYNNFDLMTMKKYNILGTNTPKVLDETVADLIFALILGAARRIPEMDRYVKDGKWDKFVGEDLFGIDVHHTTLGVIGMGRIGKAVAKRGRFGFDMNIIYCNRNRDYQAEKEIQAKYCLLDELLAGSDFVLIMTPLTNATRKLISKRELSLMKKTAILINASRGETLDEDALADALKNRVIRAAALDVYSREPIGTESPLLSLSNIITVPHIGSAVKSTRDKMAMLAAENLVSALFGEKPPNLVDELKEF